MVQSSFSGYIDSGMRLKGQTSNAEATIKSDIKLITDNVGEVIGSFFIPTGTPSFETGSKSVKIINNSTNSVINGDVISFAETIFIASGSLNKYQENIVGKDPRQIPTPTTPTNTPAKPAKPPQIQVPKPWQDGDISVRGSNVSDDEGNRLVNSINQRNGTSFSLSQLKSAAGINQLNKVSELNRINEAARRLAGR
jgi:hypothetical protein